MAWNRRAFFTVAEVAPAQLRAVSSRAASSGVTFIILARLASVSSAMPSLRHSPSGIMYLLKM